MMFSPQDRTLAIRALQRLDMVSHGLHRADELSGGQQQRVAIAARARAGAEDPPCRRADRLARSAQRHHRHGRPAPDQPGGRHHRHLQPAPAADREGLLRPHHRHAQGEDRVRRPAVGSSPTRDAREIYGGGDTGRRGGRARRSPPRSAPTVRGRCRRRRAPAPTTNAAYASRQEETVMVSMISCGHLAAALAAGGPAAGRHRRTNSAAVAEEVSGREVRRHPGRNADLDHQDDGRLPEARREGDRREVGALHRRPTTRA